MRNNIRNNKTMWYATYKETVTEYDENGDITGDDTIAYVEPVEFHANLSATRGPQGFTGTGSTVDYFGASIDYSLIISTAEMDLPIDEYSLIWTEQPVLVDGKADPNTAQYVVNAVARGKYHMKYAIKKQPGR